MCGHSPIFFDGFSGTRQCLPQEYRSANRWMGDNDSIVEAIRGSRQAESLSIQIFSL